MANSLDKIRKKMNMLVISGENDGGDEILKRSKNIICPTCGEDIKINTLSQDRQIDLIDTNLNEIENNIIKGNEELNYFLKNFFIYLFTYLR